MKIFQIDILDCRFAPQYCVCIYLDDFSSKIIEGEKKKWRGEIR